MKKLLFGIFTAIALNVQGQSFGEPQVFEKACYFIHNFVNEKVRVHYLTQKT